jgi:hypothetical protein
MVADKIANLREGRPSLTAGIQAVSQTQAAKTMNVSRDSVQKAHVVRTKGVPELQRAVEEVRLSPFSA